MAALEFDPYIAALLIALAQESCRWVHDDPVEVCKVLLHSQFSSDIAQVHVFAPSADYVSLIQYTSSISYDYLRKWGNSYKSNSSRFVIARKEIPYSRPDLIKEATRVIGEPYDPPPGTPYPWQYNWRGELESDPEEEGSD
jgi:hypothetical protein